MKEKIKSSVSVSRKKKKTQAAGSGGKKSNKDILINDLKQIIKDVDEEGLLFLIKQANVLVYNKRIDDCNTENKKPGIRIKIKKQPFSDKISMDIKEADDSSSFIFVINKARKFFTLEEMKKLVKICHISSDEKDASKRLYLWFKNNRGDVLNDIGIDNSDDYSLSTIYNFLKSKYTVKE